MFYSTVAALAGRVSEMVDDMLLGDFEYVIVDGHLLADVDAAAQCPEAARCAEGRLHTAPRTVRAYPGVPDTWAGALRRRGHGHEGDHALCSAGAAAMRRRLERG